MKIYLAGGMTVTNVKGRERELSKKFDTWKRLFSFYFKNCINSSEIINIVHENIHSRSSSE
jgi:hypothetical protein